MSVELKISEDVIKGIVSEKMKIAIVEAMGGRDKILESVLNVYMDGRVNEKGEVSSYSSDNKHKRGDVMVRHMIEKAMAEALKQYLQTRGAELQEALSKYFATKAGTSAIVKAVAEGFANSMADNHWKYAFTFNLERPKDY